MFGERSPAIHQPVNCHHGKHMQHVIWTSAHGTCLHVFVITVGQIWFWRPSSPKPWIKRTPTLHPSSLNGLGLLDKNKKLRRAIPASKLSNHGEVKTTCMEPHHRSDPRLGDSHSTQKFWGCSWEDYNYWKPSLVPEKRPSMLVSYNSFVGTWTNMTSLSLPKENIINNHPLSVGMLLGHYVSEAPQKGTITRNLECNRGSLWPLLPLQTHQIINPKIHRCIFPLQSTTMPPRELPEMNLAKPRNNKTNNVWLYSGA